MYQTTHSIIIPTRNRPEMLENACTTALAALADGGEVVVVDDHSVVPAARTLAHFEDPRLRILRNPEGETGIPATRNLGLQSARGEVLFFLDDDDEICAEYPSDVLEALKSARGKNAGFGFSAYKRMPRRAPKGAMPSPTSVSPRFATGIVPQSAPLKKRLCGFGMGFWMRRAAFETIGEVSPGLTINEDTDYLCRLIEGGFACWYSAQPGVVLRPTAGKLGEDRHISFSVSSAERARCFLEMVQRFPNMSGHLGHGYVKHCVKSGDLKTALKFAAGRPKLTEKARFIALALAKAVTFRLQRRML